MSKHTPGPWTVGPADDTVVTHLGKDGKRYEIAAIDGDYNSPDHWPTMEANARLIAAAPDMLGALKRAAVVMAGIYKVRSPDDALAKVEAAIARAEGNE